MTDFHLPEYSISDIYHEIREYQRLQSSQRLFVENGPRRYTLLTLQRM